MAARQAMFIAWGPDLQFLYNEAYAPILGKRHPGAFGRPFKEVWHDIWPQIEPLVELTMAGEASWFEDLLIPMHRNGHREEAWFSFSYTPIRQGGEVIGMLCAATETTRTVLSIGAQSFHLDLESRLRELSDPEDIIKVSQEALGKHLKTSRVGYGEVDGSERFFTTGLNWTDGSVGHYEGTHDLAAFGPEIHGALRRGEPLIVHDVATDPRTSSPESLQAFAHLETASVLTASLIKSGQMIAALYIHNRTARTWTQAEVRLVQEVAERTWSALERARAEAAQRMSEERFRKLSELSPAIVWFGNADGSLSYLNERWTEYSGQPMSEALPLGWVDVIHPDDIEHLQAVWSDARARSTFYQLEARLRRHDSSFRWFLIRAEPVIADDGTMSWIGFNNDIDDIVLARQELAQSRAALELANRELEANVQARTRDHDRLWRISQELMLVADLEGRITSVNPSASRLLGWKEEEMVGQLLLDFIHPDDLASTLAEVGKLAQGQTTLAFENRYRHRDGSYRSLSWTAVPFENFIHAVGRDISAEREAREALQKTEEALRQAQKMEAVGQLTGGIAHDFNNLLQGIIGSLDIIQRRVAQGRTGELDRFLNAATTTANRAAALTHRLLAFSRRQPLDPKPVKANQLVSQMEDLLRRTIGESIQLEMVLAGGLWTTKCDPHQLESAILNLSINARDAMPNGGKLTIETCNAHLDNAYAAREREVKPGQYVCISVSDTGTGMAPDVISRAFEPFFTTKPIGQGTGLGLSMIYGFARQSEGYAKIYSEVGQGTAVKLYLPRHYGEGEESEELPQITEEHLTQHGETVLVVEDEQVVRDLVVEVLTELGYNAIEAYDGPSGLATLQSKQKIDLLVTDIGLPGLNGRQIADAGRQLRPGLKVLFMTGYAENATLASGFLEPGMQMITKPFSMENLATRIKDMVESGRDDHTGKH
ncbi:PAS domain S-box protein [Devosia submarina]|uniref:PAS domain S-box protein n=1 Tax=Devosia submarina TaxID=1173082 RepID=UPI001475D9D0|nr:PAS domain S-box protein [Devosia submarina]